MEIDVVGDHVPEGTSPKAGVGKKDEMGFFLKPLQNCDLYLLIWSPEKFAAAYSVGTTGGWGNLSKPNSAYTIGWRGGEAASPGGEGRVSGILLKILVIKMASR